MRKPLTDIEKRCLAVVKDTPGQRAGDIGWALWGETTEAPNRGTGSHGANKFCRAAGKVLRSLQARGLVNWSIESNRVEWRPTKKAR